MACIRTKRYRFIEPKEQPDGSTLPNQVIISEQEILNKYWTFWKEQIYKIDNENTRRIRDLPLSKQCDACIDDFLVTHWAEEIVDE